MSLIANLLDHHQLRAEAITACNASSAELSAAWDTAEHPSARAALALVAGLKRRQEMRARLLAALDNDDLAARAAAWALAQLGEVESLVKGLPEGRLDRRENTYLALAYIAAQGKAPATLGQALAEAVDQEMARARAGRSGLGEKAVQVLALLGDKRAPALAQTVLDGDRYCDRAELERLRKALADHGQDPERKAALNQNWSSLFAEALASASTQTNHPETTSKEPDIAALEAEHADEEPAYAEGGANDEALSAEAIDWQAFAASPQAASLPQQQAMLLQQLGPILEQIAERALQRGLLSCNAQEIAAIFLQVLPQMLPPQYVQAALSPQALSAFKALGAFLDSQNPGTGAGLVGGLAIVRSQIQAQMRASGSLNGSIYDEPEG